jgi:hypothetical protein
VQHCQAHLHICSSANLHICRARGIGVGIDIGIDIGQRWRRTS